MVELGCNQMMSAIGEHFSERSAPGADLDHNRVADVTERLDDSPRGIRVD
jgi:hypothetical protein